MPIRPEAERRVWIAQCLCGPNRHAIAAVAGEAEGAGAAWEALVPQLREAVADLLRSGINPWCAICGAEESGWRYEVGRTRHRSMEEAAAEIGEVALQNAIANALFGTHGPKRPRSN